MQIGKGITILAVGVLALVLYTQFGYPNAVSTTVIVQYPKTNLKSTLLTVRGDNCGLTWNSGLKLT